LGHSTWEEAQAKYPQFGSSEDNREEETKKE
jgi:hypothetical protein